MKLPLLIAAAFGIASLARLPQADASCAYPEPGFLPRSGEIVPPRPSVYVFVPHRTSLGEGRVTVGSIYGIPVEPEVETVSTAGAYDVLRVRVPLEEPGEPFTVHWGYSDDPASTPRYTARYKIGAAPQNRARVLGVSRHLDHWTCSYADTIQLELEGNALAYRLAWHDGSATVLPADAGILWHWDGAPATPPPATTLAELGHVNCLGHSVEPEVLAKARGFELYALFADGSEVRIGSSSAQLGEAGVRLPLELVDAPGVGPSVGPGEATTLTVISSRLPPWWSAVLGALGGAIALVGGAIAAGLLRRARPRSIE